MAAAIIFAAIIFPGTTECNELFREYGHCTITVTMDLNGPWFGDGRILQTVLNLITLMYI